MSTNIDPKKGGLCWSCEFCEDIATQTNNPSGSYYRKCKCSGHEYIDTCKFHCSDYIWDRKHDQYVTPSSSSPSKPAPKATSAPVFKLISALITTAIFGFFGYLIYGYAEYLLTVFAGGEASLPVFSSATLIEAILIIAPFVISIVWSIIRRRKIWIGSLITIIACTIINSTIGDDTTPSHIPLYIAVVAVPYLLCLIAILKEKKD